MTESSGKNLPPNALGPGAFLSKEALDMDNPEPWCGGSLLLSNRQQRDQVRSLIDALKANQITLFVFNQPALAAPDEALDEDVFESAEPESTPDAALMPEDLPETDDRPRRKKATDNQTKATALPSADKLSHNLAGPVSSEPEAVLSWWHQKNAAARAFFKAGLNQAKGLWSAVWSQPRPGVLPGLLAGLLTGTLAAFLIYHHFNGLETQLTQVQSEAAQQQEHLNQKVVKLKKDLEAREMDLNNLSLGYSQLSKLLSRSNEPPPKPRYKTIGSQLFIYWVDEVLWRRYYVYRSGPNGKGLTRQSARAQKKNFIFIDHLPKGVWSFAVSALDKEGRETARSQAVTIVMK